MVALTLSPTKTLFLNSHLLHSTFNFKPHFINPYSTKTQESPQFEVSLIQLSYLQAEVNSRYQEQGQEHIQEDCVTLSEAAPSQAEKGVMVVVVVNCEGHGNGEVKAKSGGSWLRGSPERFWGFCLICLWLLEKCSLSLL